MLGGLAAAWWLSNLSGRSCIHSGWGGVGWPAWHSRLPVATSLLGPTCVRHQAPLARRLPALLLASSSQVTRQSCPHFSAASSRPASRSHQVSRCFTNSPNLRFPRSSLVSAHQVPAIGTWCNPGALAAWESEERVQLVVASIILSLLCRYSLTPLFGKGRARLNICSGHQTHGTIAEPWAE